MKRLLRVICLCAVIMLLLLSLCVGAIYYLPASLLPGYQGTLYIEAVNIAVPLWDPSWMSKSFGENSIFGKWVSQAAVDKENCALLYRKMLSGYIPEGGSADVRIIADHNYQGFERLVSCQEAFEAVILRPDGEKETYIAVQAFAGTNTGTDLIDSEEKSAISRNPGGIILYTCLDQTQIPVWIVFLTADY